MKSKGHQKYETTFVLQKKMEHIPVFQFFVEIDIPRQSLF